jgi:membrane protein DedA with SNARE-associated domain
MSDTLLHLVEHFGYVIVAALILAEGVGLPLPGEAALVIGSALAATTGRLTLIGVMIAAAVGAIGGAAGGYWIGASLSDARLHRWAARFGMAPARLERAQQTFRKHIVRTAILGRFVTLLRMVVALLAGAIYGTLGYVFGSNLPRLEHELGRSSVIILLAVILVGVLLYARHRRRVESEP